VSIKPRTADVIIYQGDDLATLSDLRGAAELAQRLYEDSQKSGTNRIGDAPDPQPAKDAYDAFIDEAAGRAETVTLRAIGRRHWRDLFDENPPRMVKRLIDGEQTEVVHPDDEPFGVDTKVFGEKLLNFDHDGVRTITVPEFPTAAARTEFVDNISEGDFDRLWTTAYYLNTSLGLDPGKSRYSAARVSSNATSE
jgi:hypothetical protein